MAHAPSPMRSSILLSTPIASFVIFFFLLPVVHAATSSSFEAQLTSVSTGACLNAPGTPNTGTILSQAICSVSPQSFAFVAQSNGTAIVHPPSSPNLCVDLNDSGVLVENFCLPTASQQWLSVLHGDGSLSLINQQNGQCLLATANGFITDTCSVRSTAQKFAYLEQQAYTPPPPPTNLAPPVTPVVNPTVGQWQAGMFQTIPYRILFPAGYDPSNTIYSLVLFLHGDGERGTNNLSQLNDDLNTLNTDIDFRTKAPLIIVAPQCPTTDTWGSAFQANPTATETLAVELVQTLASALPVDPDRISVTGLSMGGLGSWDMINRYSSLFGAAAPIAGAGSAALEAANLVNVPILAVHSAQDPIIPASYDEAMYAAIHAAGGKMIYIEVPGENHGVWNLVYPETQFWQWIMAQVHD